RDARRDARALEVERRRADVPAAVLLADEVLLRHAHVVEEDLVEVVVVRHVDERTDGDAWGLHIDDEVTNALVLRRVGVRAREQDHVLGDVRAGGPDLLAVDDVVVAVLDGPRLHGGEVGAGAGFGEALAPDVVALDDAREVLLLLLLGAVEDDGRAGPAGADAEVAPAWRAGERHLLREDELLHDGHAGAAVLLRPGRGDPAAVGELLHPLAVALEVFGTVHVD